MLLGIRREEWLEASLEYCDIGVPHFLTNAILIVMSFSHRFELCHVFRIRIQYPYVTVLYCALIARCRINIHLAFPAFAPIAISLLLYDRASVLSFVAVRNSPMD
jgi:hypothetical protein